MGRSSLGGEAIESECKMVDRINEEFLKKYTGMEFKPDNKGGFIAEKNGIRITVDMDLPTNIFVFDESDKRENFAIGKRIRCNLLLAIEQNIMIPNLFRWKRVSPNECVVAEW